MSRRAGWATTSLAMLAFAVVLVAAVARADRAGPTALLHTALQVAAIPGDAPALEIWSANSLVKVRPGDPPPAAPPRAAAIAAARNEFEAFQLVLRAGEHRVRGVDVEARDLVGEGGFRIPAGEVTLYFERDLELAQPSNVEGGTGEWPDPLVPRVDRYAGERRNAFPFDVGAGRSQPLWVEVFVPPGTPPGSYRSELRISVPGQQTRSFPWTLRVWGFTLPATSSYQSSFGFSGISALRAHYGGYTDQHDLEEITRLYTIAGLRHRISFYGGTMAAPSVSFHGGTAKIDWQPYDREVAPQLDGTLLPAGSPLAGARAVTIEARSPADLDDRQQALYWRAWVEHFRERGWLDRLFYYVWDEPQPGDYPKVYAKAKLAREGDPHLRVLLTEQFTPELAPVVDIWVQVINCFETDPCGGRVVPASTYAAARARGSELWWYESCMSHGCGVVGGKPFTGWPSYVIDAPGVAHRILPWLAWTYGIQGEVYYNTVEAFNGDDDPWVDVYRFGGNGDGTLFYPGTPRWIGGKTQIPIESLRLKMIRDGLEDYEYLALLARRAGAGRVRTIAEQLAPGLEHWNHSPEALYAARAEIAREIESATTNG